VKVGDPVMFVDTGRYAKWFYGQLGIVESHTKAQDGTYHVRVRWMRPVQYIDRQATISDFPESYFYSAR